GIAKSVERVRLQSLTRPASRHSPTHQSPPRPPAMRAFLRSESGSPPPPRRCPRPCPTLPHHPTAGVWRLARAATRRRCRPARRIVLLDLAALEASEPISRARVLRIDLERAREQRAIGNACVRQVLGFQRESQAGCELGRVAVLAESLDAPQRGERVGWALLQILLSVVEVRAR